MVHMVHVHKVFRSKGLDGQTVHLECLNFCIFGPVCIYIELKNPKYGGTFLELK